MELKTIFFKIIPLLILFLFNGCANRSVNVTNPSADKSYDVATCWNEARQQVKAVIVQPSAPTGYSTQCSRSGNSVQCQTTSDQMAGAQAGAQQAIEDTKTYSERSAFVNYCLMRKGWRDVSNQTNVPNNSGSTASDAKLRISNCDVEAKASKMEYQAAFRICISR